jgi:hypothetical protein
MMNIKYDKLSKIRLTRGFNDMDSDDQDTSLLYLGEELIENIQKIDSWMSDEAGDRGNKFDPTNINHVRLFAKLNMLNDELENIIEKTGDYIPSIR